MQKSIITLILFLLQILFLLNGQHIAGTALNPFIILFISLLLPIYYLWVFLNRGKTTENIKHSGKFGTIIGFALGCITILLAFVAIRRLFWDFPDPRHSSDVILSVEVLYDRFTAGIYPYQPLEQYEWHPFPPYLPLYWLPVSISRFMQIDVRWTGVFFLVLAAGAYGIFCWRSYASILHKMLALFLPLVGLTGYLIWGRFDLAVSFEFIIAAYYLILAAGLATKSLPMVALGLICCLLSRFTMIFWLPVFVILIWFNVPKKNVLLAAGVVLAAILFIYIIPFHLKDPSAFGQAMAYYKKSAVGEWQGYGDDHTSWTFMAGVHFAPYFKQMFHGTIEERVTSTQTFQAILMLVLIAAGLLLYRKWRRKINFYDFSLAMLYIIMLFYFMTAPLVFKYYYLTFLMVSATLCGKLIVAENANKKKST